MKANVRHADDDKRLRHGRDQHQGFAVGRYLQSPPMLFTRDGHNVFLGDMYRGRAAFLVCGGPSLTTHDLSQLNQRGILTCGVNNAAAVYRPNLWVSADDPGNFCDAIWRDPAILKFVPLCHMEKHFMVRDAEERLVASDEVVGDLPAVFGFRRNEVFNAETWLYEDSFNWGSHSSRADAYGNKGSRSIMYIALRLLYFLGVRRVYLLGCDFRMQYGQKNYAFEQDRSAGSVSGNNSSYRILNTRLKHLLPHFEREGFEIFNCTPDSGLTVFPHVSYEEAIEQCRAEMPTRIVTVGMYDRQAAASRKEKARVAQPGAGTGNGHNRTSQSQLPQMTLVVGLTPEDVPVWKHTWRTWIRFKPWLKSLPLLVIHDAGINAREIQNGHAIAKYIPISTCDTDVPDRRFASALIKVPAEQVTTPWYLRLDPRAIAVDERPWIFPDWFTTDAKGRPPVFVTCPWNYTKPADAIARLDDWGDTVKGLVEFPRLDLSFDHSEDRINHPTINSWCFFASTDWTRATARITPDELPHLSLSTFIHYCAARQQKHFIRVQIKDFGWEHHFRSRDWFIQRCEKILS